MILKQKFTYSSVHNASSMGAYRICDVPNIDGIQVLVVAGPLNKDLQE